MRLRTDPQRVGVVEPGERDRGGRRSIAIRVSDGALRYFPEDALERVPASRETLVDKVSAGAFASPDWLRRMLARTRVTGRLGNVVYSMEATGTDFYAHQFKPVLKLLNSPTDALLVADEVGLGKTIEAGLIWTELRARVDASRLLVVCPGTLCEKWRMELDRRFGVDAHIVDARSLLELLSSQQHRKRGFAAIASMSALRPTKGWKDDALPDGSVTRGPRAELARLLRAASEDEPLIDLLVVDEAHHMRNPETLLHDFGVLANAVATYRVFLSATPIHLRNRDLHSLLKLVDPDTFEFEGTLDRIIAANAPLVAARDRILDGVSSAAEILELIHQARQIDLLSDSQTLAVLRDEVGRRPLDRTARSEIAGRLDTANQLANYVARTRRRDVEEFRVTREPKAPALSMVAVEREFYDAMSGEIAEYALESDANAMFLLSMPQRLVSSSPAAAAVWWESQGKVPDLDDEEAQQAIHEDGAASGAESHENFRPLVTRLSSKARELGLSRKLREVDSKFSELVRQLHMLWNQEPDAKIVLFSSFRATLSYLRGRLSEIEVPSELLHGSVREPRDAILRRFREHEGRCVLLSSEVGSEGVDLQFCWIVINYDLPWNPMRLEQRIGRVDRLGQRREKVTILNLIYDATIDHRIYHRLYERLELVTRALGEFEAVLGEPIQDLTRQLLDPQLTEEQKNRAIDQTAQALENRAQDAARLEHEAGALVQHGDFVLSQILESRELHRWLDGGDIHFYVKDRLQRSFAGVAIEASPPGSDTYRIDLSQPARDAFAQFMAERRSRAQTRLLEGDDRQRYRFTASVLRSNEARIENIAQTHPLTQFAASLDEQDDETRQPQAAAALLRPGDVPGVEPGDYLILVRRWAATDGRGQPASLGRLAYTGMRTDAGLAELPDDRAEALVMAAATNGTTIVNLRTDPRCDGLADRLATRLEPAMDERYAAFEREIVAEAADRMSTRLSAVEGHVQRKMADFHGRIQAMMHRATSARLDSNTRGAQRFEALVAALEQQKSKLNEFGERRRQEIERGRRLTPEEVDLAVVLVEIRE